MKKWKKVTTILTAALISQSSYPCSEDGKDGFVEENNLWISADAKKVSNVTEGTFHKIIDDIKGIYAPVVAEKGATLEVERFWDNGTVNAYARRSGNTWFVAMYGGLARHETVTPDGFALVVCHELGHHLGGVPKKKSYWGTTWASNEGQSDYFGALKCLRRYFEGDNNQEVVANMEIPDVVRERCDDSFATNEEVAICLRSSMAGYSLGKLLGTLGRTPDISFDSPDRSIASRTNHNHPKAQCRLDTYFAGSVCTVHHSVDVSDSDYVDGTCTSKENYDLGTRPLCWFNSEVL